jgi:hypothetical protein
MKSAVSGRNDACEGVPCWALSGLFHAGATHVNKSNHENNTNREKYRFCICRPLVQTQVSSLTPSTSQLPPFTDFSVVAQAPETEIVQREAGRPETRVLAGHATTIEKGAPRARVSSSMSPVGERLQNATR